uniref:Non-specific serine/threonine protein kinase n=1 Tax=Panagrolaimus sp. PS1159 TaxID=55785 RepID=A0AC35G170_9BILA
MSEDIEMESIESEKINVNECSDESSSDEIEIDYEYDDTLIAEKEDETTTDDEEDGSSSSVDISRYQCQQLDIGVEDFEILRVLGRGGFGKVSQVKKKNGIDKGTVFAMKAIKKSRIFKSQKDLDHTKTERKVLEISSNPFICDLFYAFQTSTKLYLILEYLHGGELFMLLEKEGCFMEHEAQFYAAEILLALEHLHHNGVIYRTVEYMSPEIILKKGHAHTTDFWGLGILLYDMLVGSTPYTSADRNQTIDRILKSRLKFPKHVGLKAQGLIKKLLRRTVSQRIGYKNGAKEVKDHEFFDNINWEDVFNKRLQPPFRPSEVNNFGLFDPQFTNLPPIETPDLSLSHDNDPFENFDYVSPSIFSNLTTESSRENESTPKKSLSNPKLLSSSSLKNWSFSPISKSS